MAVKERKQITGTTAQIQAYAGHEGQIVWDKDKKTLVGMSGTAGKNYPLAPQAYVDNEVAKVNAEVEKTNAEVAKKQPKGNYATTTQLTEGLAGKEDKGVCLPLTGGLLSGFLELDPNYGAGNIDIGFSFEEKLGSGFGFRSVNYAKEPGAFSIYARDLTQTTMLIGEPNGTLKWAGKPLTYKVSEGYNKTSGYYIRYSDGTQICAHKTESRLAKAVISYPVPFKALYAPLVDHVDAKATSWNETTITVITGSGQPIGFFSYFAIGTWK